MKRTSTWLWQIVVFLSLGALTSLALAWAVAAAAPLPKGPPMGGGSFLHADKVWHVVERRSFGRLVLGWSHATGDYATAAPLTMTSEERAIHAEQTAKITREEVLAQLRKGTAQLVSSRPGFTARNEQPAWGTLSTPEPDVGHFNSGADWLFGWPLPSLWFQVRGVSYQNVHDRDEITGGIMLSGTPCAVVHNFRALPVWPAWGGLVGNSLLCGLMWFALIRMPGITRRAVRRRHNRCEFCGYDLRGQAHAGCPECGTGRPAAGVES